MEDRYAFLMVRYDTPNAVKMIQNGLRKEDLYNPEKDDGFEYGIESDTHVTIAACLDNDIDLDELKKLLSPLSNYRATLDGLSLFENEDFDVLKCDVKCDELVKTNKKVLSRFESHSEYKDYHPHLTLAYIKKGKGKEYISNGLCKDVKVKPTGFRFSWWEGDVQKNINF